MIGKIVKTTVEAATCVVSNDQKIIAYMVNLIASCLSIIGSSAIIINFIFFLTPAKKKQPLYQLILCLSIADFFGSLSICISQSILLSSVPYYHSFCIIIRGSINFFFVASFMWMSSVAFHAYWSSRQRSQVPLWVFHLISWGIPLVMTAVMIGRDMITEDAESGWCHPNPVARWAFWYAPLLFSLTWNILLYAMILWQYRSSMRPSSVQVESLDYPYKTGHSINHMSSSHRFINEKKKKLHRKVAKRLGIYFLAFLICWIPDLFDNLLVKPNQYCEYYWLWILQNFTSPLQGFLNMIVYGISSHMFFLCTKKDTIPDIRSIHESKSQKISLLRGD